MTSQASSSSVGAPEAPPDSSASSTARRPRRDAILLTTDYAPQLGGIAEYLGGLWRQSLACGNPLVYSTLAEPTSVKPHPITLPAPPSRRLGERMGDSVSAIRRMNTLAHFAALRRYARRTLASVLPQLDEQSRVCIGLWSPLAHFWCETLAAAGRPYALVAHGLDVIQPMYPTVAPWRKADFLGASRVIANSAGTGAMARERLGLDPARLRVINPGIDISGYVVPSTERLNAARAALDVHDGPIVLSVGRLVQRKGFDVALRAFAAHRKAGGTAQYVLAGEGPERQALKALADELGVGEHVRFAGAVNEQTKLALYALCDVFVMPNRLLNSVDWEGFGIVFLEAARAGKPSIGGANGGVPDAVEHGVTGLLVDPEDGRAVAAALTSLLSDGDLRLRLGAAARARAAAQFDWPIVGERFYSVLQEPW